MHKSWDCFASNYSGRRKESIFKITQKHILRLLSMKGCDEGRCLFPSAQEASLAQKSPFRHEKKLGEGKMFLCWAKTEVPTSKQVSGAGRLVEEKQGE